MWDKLNEPWRECIRLAWDSYCEGYIPIAAVITNAEGRIISTGRNRSSLSKAKNHDRIIGGPIAHAEISALLALDWENIDEYSLELYTTVEPCPLCIGAVYMTWDKTIKYAARGTWFGSTNLLYVSPYLRWKQIKAYPPEDTEHETIILMLQVEGQLTLPHPRAEDVLDTWSKYYPDDVRKGRLRYESGNYLQ